MRPQIVTILALVLSIWNSTVMLGQTPSAGSNPPPPPQRTPVDLPLDTSIYLLFIAAIALGVYVLIKRRTSKL